jgi:hypothetical protein
MNQTIGWLNGEMRALPAAWFTKAIDPDVTLMHQPAGLQWWCSPPFVRVSKKF